MDIFLMIWFVIDMMLLIILPLRKYVTKDQNVMYRRSIESVKNLGARFNNMLFIIFLIFIGCVIIYSVPDQLFQKFLEWYKGIFIIVLFPMFFARIKEKSISIWNSWLTISVVLFSIVGYFIDIENIKSVSKYRAILNVLITILIIIFIVAVFEMWRENKKYCSKKLPKKGIRRDLYYRTPSLVVNVSNIELSKYCEKYFDEYISRYKKIKELRTIEFVNLVGIHRKLWYKKVACFMKIFVVLSLFVVVISKFFGESYKSLGIIGLIFVFGVLISIYKHIDLECLYIIVIRWCYDDWCYYLTSTNRSKFVGTVQIIEKSKYHTYIHSFLDIVALCRAVAFSDKMNREKKICIITSNLSDLFANYSDYMENQNWIMLIPLWAAALFEFNVTGKISHDVKTILKESVDESVRMDISIFLQSFWADIEKKELKEGISKYIQVFEEKLYD